jgi:hypothetical protein
VSIIRAKMSFFYEENVYLLKLFGGIIMKYLFRASLFLFVFIGFTSCDDLDLSLDENQSEDVLGVWKERYTGSRNVFMLISNSEFNFYEIDSNLNCAKIDANRVIRRDGVGFFQVDKGDGTEPFVYAVTNNDGDLHLRAIDDSDEGIRYFWPSETDLSAFSECLDETDIQGKWEFISQNGFTYVDIKDDSIRVFNEIVEESCFEIIDYKIDGSNGNIYRLLDEIATDFVSELFVEIKRTQNGLEITLEDGNETITDIYLSSSTDFSTLQDCGFNFSDEKEGIWEFEAVAGTTESLLHLELKQDTLRYYTELIKEDCIDINNHVVQSRRGNTYFLADAGSDVITLIYQIFFDNDVLVTRLSNDTNSIDERFVRSTTTLAQLESNICTSDF